MERFFSKECNKKKLAITISDIFSFEYEENNSVSQFESKIMPHAVFLFVIHSHSMLSHVARSCLFCPFIVCSHDENFHMVK